MSLADKVDEFNDEKPAPKLPSKRAKPAKRTEPKYGKTQDGGYETPYRSVIFYSAEDFKQSALAFSAKSPDIIAYNDNFAEIDWTGLGDLPEYLAPKVILFDAFTEQIPQTVLGKFAERGFPEVWIIGEPAKYAGWQCKVGSYENIWDWYDYVDAAHYECVERLLKGESRELFLGLTFAQNTATAAAEAFARLAKSGMRVGDNFLRCEMRGVAVDDLRHHIGKGIAASAWRVGKFLVAFAPPVLLREGDPNLHGSVLTQCIEHMTAAHSAEHGALIWPTGDTFYVRSWQISAPPPTHAPYLSKAELRALLGADVF
jgi:hypothetical protein